jgi:hypothetical protein|eukprot:COSAG02_NODE_4230_length_5609_cov_6.098911_4_plen_178_part_00
MGCVRRLEQLSLAAKVYIGGAGQRSILLSAVLQAWASRSQNLLCKASSRGWRNPNGRTAIQGRTLSRWHTIAAHRVRDRHRGEKKVIISLLRLQLNMVRRWFGAWYCSAQRTRRQELSLSPVATPQTRSDGRSGSPIPKGDVSIADLLDRSLDQPWLRTRTTGTIVSSDDESSDGSR